MIICITHRWSSKLIFKVRKSQILGLIPQSQICKFLRYASLANCKLQSFMIYLQIAKMQISRNYCTTLSQNSTKVVFLKRFLCYVHIWIRALYAIFVTWNTQKDCVANRKSAKCFICGRSANLTNFFSLQICGFEICGTYLWTAHLWYYCRWILQVDVWLLLTLV
jgi:hypothetical protein